MTIPAPGEMTWADVPEPVPADGEVVIEVAAFAIQYAKAVGARVVVTARAVKHAALRELGADVCLDYTADDFSQVRADVVLDIMGASYLERNLDALAVDGRLIIIGLQGGRKSRVDLSKLLSKRATVAGTTLRSRSTSDKATIIRGYGQRSGR